MMNKTQTIRYNPYADADNLANDETKPTNWSINKDNWKQQIFLLLWSLGSGYGIIFAIESFFYEYYQINSQSMTALKGIIALSVGLSIGLYHFSLTVDDGSPKAHPLILELIAERQKATYRANVKALITNDSNQESVEMQPVTPIDPKSKSKQDIFSESLAEII
eukprot:153323_1